MRRVRTLRPVGTFDRVRPAGVIKPHDVCQRRIPCVAYASDRADLAQGIRGRVGSVCLHPCAVNHAAKYIVILTAQQEANKVSRVILGFDVHAPDIDHEELRVRERHVARASWQHLPLVVGPLVPERPLDVVNERRDPHAAIVRGAAGVGDAAEKRDDKHRVYHVVSDVCGVTA